MKNRKVLWLFIISITILFSAGCAGVPVRDAFKVDMSVPVGKIEGKEFTGIRYPFKVAAPANWEIATEFPKFMIDLGYEKEGLEESQVFIFNPVTQSNLQIDFTPAGRYAKFDQKIMEALVSSITADFRDEVEKDMGKGTPIVFGPTETVSLKGVQYAAKKYAIYQAKGVKREQGWIYAFSEPYQMFILYMILEKEGVNDLQAIQAILDSFAYTPTK